MIFLLFYNIIWFGDISNRYVNFFQTTIVSCLSDLVILYTDDNWEKEIILLQSYNKYLSGNGNNYNTCKFAHGYLSFKIIILLIYTVFCQKKVSAVEMFRIVVAKKLMTQAIVK